MEREATMSFTIGTFGDSTQQYEFGFKVKGFEGDEPIIFMIPRKTFMDRYPLSAEFPAAFRQRWGQVQAACALAYERAKGRKALSPGEPVMVGEADFQAD
jgi:hypothetical protein